MRYELRVEKFFGPIEKLLELIEEKNLQITELSLAQVTADFLRYLKELSQKAVKIDSRLLADFVVVAAKLLLIKSKSLLPDLKLGEEEERGIKDLETQLKFFQNFKPALNILKQRWGANYFMISRSLFHGRAIFFQPSANITLSNLERAINRIFETLKSLELETKQLKSEIISLEEKIKEIMNLLKSVQSGQMKFEALREKRSRSEIIVMFLALLHLISYELVDVEQPKRFSDIIIKSRNIKHGA